MRLNLRFESKESLRRRVIKPGPAVTKITQLCSQLKSSKKKMHISEVDTQDLNLSIELKRGDGGSRFF